MLNSSPSKNLTDTVRKKNREVVEIFGGSNSLTW